MAHANGSGAMDCVRTTQLQLNDAWESGYPNGTRMCPDTARWTSLGQRRVSYVADSDPSATDPSSSADASRSMSSLFASLLRQVSGIAPAP